MKLLASCMGLVDEQGLLLELFGKP